MGQPSTETPVPTTTHDSGPTKGKTGGDKKATSKQSPTQKAANAVLDLLIPRGVQSTWLWFTGLGPNDVSYNASDAETQEMMEAWGPLMEEEFRNHNYQDTGFNAGHFQALWVTILKPALTGHLPLGTAAQVGGFQDAYVENVGNGKVHFHITNTLGSESLCNYYNILNEKAGNPLPHIGNVPWQSGPLSSVRQSFDWYENLSDLKQ